MKLNVEVLTSMGTWSPPTRGRELKLQWRLKRPPVLLSPPTRGRELKQREAPALRNGAGGRPPRGGAS